MANSNNPFGLRPVRRMDGSPWTGKATAYYIPSTDSNAYHIGDPVDITGNSNAAEVIQGGGKWGPGMLSEVAHATLASTNFTIGPIVGFLPATRDSTVYGAASTERVALVCDDPNVVFQVQDDGGGTLVADTVGLNAIMITGTGNNFTGQSGKALDGGTGTGPGANNAYMLLILALSNIEGNTFADFGIWDVMISMHRYRATGDATGSLGIA